MSRLPLRCAAPCALLFLAGCAHTVAASQTVHEEAPKPQTVQLRFAWPHEVHADIDVTTRRTSLQAPESKTAYHLHFEAVTTGDLLRASLSAATPAQPGVFPYSYTVARNGAFVEVEGVDELFAKALSAVPKSSWPSEDWLSMHKSSFVHGVRSQWNEMVGAWMGRSFTVGTPVECTSLSDAVIVPGAQVKTTNRFVVMAFVPCEPGSGRAACVELRQTGRVLPESQAIMREGIRRQLADAVKGPAKAQVVVHEYDASDETTVIAEPETLRPFRVRVVHTDHVDATMEGKRVVQEQVLERVEVFHYRPADAGDSGARSRQAPGSVP